MQLRPSRLSTVQGGSGDTALAYRKIPNDGMNLAAYYEGGDAQMQFLDFYKHVLCYLRRCGSSFMHCLHHQP